MNSKHDLLQDLIDGNVEQSKVLLNSLDRSKARYEDIGWLYALRNPAFEKRLLKIGKTARFPTERAEELGQATGVPEGFRLIHYVHVFDRHKAEKYVHNLLAPSRYREAREFFEVSVSRVAEVFGETARRYPLVVESGGENMAVPQDYGQPQVVRCEACRTKNKVRPLYADIRLRCSECGRQLPLETESG